MKKANSRNGFTLIELTMVIVIISLLFTVFEVSRKVVEQGRLINAINLTAQQQNVIENNKLLLWLETSMPTRGKENGYQLKDWDDLSKNKILFVPSDFKKKTSFEEKRIFPGIKSVHFDGYNVMESKKGLNLLSYTAFIVAKPDGKVGYILDSGFKLTAKDAQENLITVITNDGTTKSLKSGLDKEFIGIDNIDILNSRPEKIYLGTENFTGEVFEVIIFDGVLDDDDIYLVETYLYRKYFN